MEIINSELNDLSNNLSDSLDILPNEISANIKDFIFSKSKRLRPILIFLISKSLNIFVSQDILDLATAVEIIHNATLIHDDIIDNAKIRRGRISLNMELGNNLSVLSGDILLSVAMQILSKLNNIQIINLFSSTLQKMCIGEIKQNSSLNIVPSFDDYIQKSQYKTAELFSASLKSLCLLKNINEIEQITNFAINFGIAFQINDDLKNILKKDTTKPELIDIYNGIYTLPVILLAQNNIEFNTFSKDRIIDLLSDNSQEIIKTKEIIKKYSDTAIDYLNFMQDNQYKDKLKELTLQLYKVF